MPGVYDGFTVVELADRRNQFVGKLLSDGGARVIQVEPLTGSPGRWCGPFVNDKPDADRCLDYWWYNTGKESVCIDVTQRAGAGLLRRLLAGADAFVESTRPGTLAGAGLDYGTVSRDNPGLLYLSLTDFGQDGPWRDYAMNDVAHLALGGQMGSSGYSDSSATPIGGQGHQAWHMGGVLALHALSLALFERLSSGKGQFIDCAIHDCAALCTESAIPAWVYEDRILFRQTGQHAQSIRQPPLQLQAADGQYMNCIATHFSNHLWINLVKWMEEAGVAGELSDDKYRDEVYRAQDFRQGTAIRDGIRRLISSLPAEELFHRAQSFGLTWSIVRAPEENYALPHFQERGFFRPVEQPEIGRTVSFPRGPYLSEQFQIEPRRRAPQLGEHTRAVLNDDLGLNESEIEALVASEVVR